MWKLCKNWGSKRGDDALPPRLTTKLRAKEANKESEGRYWGIRGHYWHQAGRWDMGETLQELRRLARKKCAKCNSNWAPTEFHPSLHNRIEYSDVLLETMFNLALNTVILHSQIIPECVSIIPLITPEAPEIMHLGRFCLQGLAFRNRFDFSLLSPQKTRVKFSAFQI